MANFIVTFRISSDNDYKERYESFVTTLVAYAGGAAKVWDETTSFYVFEKDATADAVCSHLYLESKFNATKDMMVVIDVGRHKKATKGPIPYEFLLTSYLGF